MPYLHLDLPRTYSKTIKRDLATRLCRPTLRLCKLSRGGQTWESLN